MIKKEEVKHIAKLARLGLNEKETATYQKELSLILGYIEKLKKVKLTGVETTSHPFQVENVTRRDEGRPSKQKLLSLAPETKAGFVKVKSILK